MLQLRSAVLAALIGGSILAAGCTPMVRDSGPASSAIPPSTASSSTPALPHPIAHERAAPPPASAESVPTTAASEPAKPTAEQYDDLFDRMRAGFQLEEVDENAVDTQLSWYANHPQYLERTFGRGERYLYYIVSQLEERKMPLELALLPVVESAFEPFGYSRARASGLWQFIPGTGTRFGLKQNWWYDGRRDVVEATRAALDYLQFLHTEFNGDWLLAVAAYNCGEVYVQRAVQNNLDAGRPTDFWNLKLPRETRAYVPKLLAMKRLVAHPDVFGLEFSPIPNEPYFAQVDTGGQIDLRMAAELSGVEADELAHLNPAFNRWATDPEGPYRLLLPVDSSELFLSNLAQVPESERVRVMRHEVRSGDTLSSIAKHYGISVAVIKQLNGISTSNLRAGQDLILPASGGALHPSIALAAARVDGRADSVVRGGNFHVVRRGESLWSIAQNHGLDVRSLASWNGMQPGDLLPAGRKLTLRSSSSVSAQTAAVDDDGKRLTYTVRSGDTLSDIARRFSVSVSQLLSWNGLNKRHTLRPGQRLVMYVASARSG